MAEQISRSTRSKKAALTTEDPPAETPPPGPAPSAEPALATTVPEARKRGRPRKDTASSSGTAPPAKKSREKKVVPPRIGNEGEKEDGDSAATTGKPGAKKRVPRLPPPRSEPLPQRSTRVVNPAAPVMPRPIRKPGEAAAEERRRQELLLELEELEKKKLQALAALEVETSQADAEEEYSAITHLSQVSDISHQVTGSQPEDIEITETTGALGAVELESDIEMMDELLLEDVEEHSGGEAPQKKRTRKKKAGKGETRNKVEEIKETLRASKTPVNSTSTKSSTKAISGLISNWESKATKLRASSHQRSTTKAAGQESDQEVLGGLDDDDAAAIPPTVRDPQSHNNRKNELVGFVADSKPPASEDPTQLVQNPKSMRSKPSTKKLQTTNLLSSAPVHKRSPSTSIEPSEILSTPSTPSTALNDGQSESVAHLPEFARAAWASAFLPTLYAFLAASETPWSPAGADGDLVPALQDIVNTVWPGTNYRVRYNDRIFKTARDRLNDKRSLIGQNAVKAVTEHFKQPQYAGDRNAIATFAAYANRSDGPGLYRIPASISASPADVDYVKPDTLFESTFFISTLASFLKFTKNSRKEYGRPKGALALCAAAVERAFNMFYTGTKVTTGKFGKDTAGAMTDDYVALVNKISERRWKLVLQLCGSNNAGPRGSGQPTSAPPLRQSRRDFYQPSSPPPDDSDDN
ncbi:hypothetical protein PLICRDRAFT_180340 [Plicaturopsis crispa FD-325 SS-3]|uniref:Uncharacterized protein n=1 Tax=Plicaturopsis crispa FD-325 SS-3 TaxID=944288 RepID=A0A0C9SQB8_PLICR|nr:hypothetical protein PLICRDRAFT_180340 [Plicaturopsis crispa FD-325 SS-3]